jgi:signal transduction histidine kinase
MSDAYFTSLLLIAGTCLGFALHAATLASQTRNRQYLQLFLLSLLEAAYCGIAYRYFSLNDSAEARPWGQSICLFTPYITYCFGQLALGLAVAPAWLSRFQRLNLALTSAFVAAVLGDMLFETRWVFQPGLRTDLSTAHRHRLLFTHWGNLYLTFVSVAFTTFAMVLHRGYRARRDLLPMLLGCVAYFAATILDFGILTDLRDGYFIQHFGFFALVLGSWRVLARRFERSLDELRQAVARLEEQRTRLLLSAPMLHRQRLDGLGTLAAAIAHEISSPIQGIISYAGMLKRSVRDDDLASSFATKIDQEGERVANIVRGLLRFGRADESELTSADIGEIVRSTLALTQNAVKHDGIALRVSLPEGLPSLRCRPYQVQQVLINLINNARDAINTRGPQRTDDKQIQIVAAQEQRTSGAWIVLSIHDSGDGVDRSVADRIFDPFFTTKGDSGGTGLGLAISQGIVEAHGGRLTLASSHLRGTTFVIELPCGVQEGSLNQVSA